MYIYIYTYILESSARFARASGHAPRWGPFPWALVGPCGDRALPWALPWALRGPCGDWAMSGPQQIRKNSYFQRPKTLNISS